MNTKPLTYDSLRTVLQHTDANVSFWSKTQVVLPGDVPYSPLTRIEFGIKDEELRRLETELVTDEKRLALLRSIAPRDNRNDEEPANTAYNLKYLQTFLRVPLYRMFSHDELNDPTVEESRRKAIQTLKNSTESDRQRLQPFLNKRDNIPCIYQKYMRIRIKNELTNQEVYECLNYTQKIYFAWKSLNTFIFGNRRSIVHIKQLKSDTGIIRMPIGLKMKVREMFLSNKVGELKQSFENVIEDSSYPLEIVRIHLRGDHQKVQLPIVKSARKLIIEDALGRNTLLPLYQNLQNETVHTSDGNLLHTDYLELIRNCLEVGRKEGTCYTFKFKFVDTIRNALGCVTIPMSKFSNLKASFKVHEGLEDGDDKAEGWVLKIEVVPVRPNADSI